MRASLKIVVKLDEGLDMSFRLQLYTVETVCLPGKARSHNA